MYSLLQISILISALHRIFYNASRSDDLFKRDSYDCRSDRSSGYRDYFSLKRRSEADRRCQRAATIPSTGDGSARDLIAIYSIRLFDRNSITARVYRSSCARPISRLFVIWTPAHQPGRRRTIALLSAARVDAALLFRAGILPPTYAMRRVGLVQPTWNGREPAPDERRLAVLSRSRTCARRILHTSV